RTAALREEVAKRKQAQEEVQRNLDRIRALHEIDNAITSSLDLTKTLSVLIEKIEIFVPHVASTTIRFINHKSGELEFIASRPIPVDEWKAYAATARRGLAYKVFESGASLAVPDIASDPSISDWEFFRRHRLGSFLGIPLTAKGEKLGVICFHTRGRRQFSDDEIEFLTTLAGQAAIAIHNAQLYEETVRANKVKEEFLSVMSHELRTPLNVVMGYTAMMRDGLLGEINPKQGEALAKIISRSNDQLGMVNNILCATVFEAQKIKVQAQPVVLGEFLNQLRTDYEGFVDKPLELKWDCSSPSVVVHTDGPKLKQALQNLIDNAVKFTQRGSVTVSASVKEAIGIRQQWVEFKVADTGIGIPQEHLPFVFERFRQADSSETRLYGGVGLGLYIAKKFTELLGGKVEAESEEGKGSTFTVTLPINPTYRMSPEGA
ncbi:MAG: GAF domain-containing sensor histidine kinase, partial [Deltaproteobacteria bacterium]|nr:GAF domain-containing sensor histidine kinase [Deltaproteobacteria bacterium]